MTLRTPLWQENSSYSATLDRGFFDALFTSPGIIGSGANLQVSQHGTPNMSVDVTAGSAVVTGSDVSGQGKYLVVSDASVNVPIAAAPGAGLARFDTITATVRDADADGGSNNDWVIQAITGTAVGGGAETPPTSPASSMDLAWVHVASGVTTIITSLITDLRRPAQLTDGDISYTVPTLQNSWVPLGSTTDPPGFRRDGTNHIEFRGSAKSGTTTVGTLLFTLPPLCRPNKVTKGMGISNGALFGVLIDPTGPVTVWFGAVATDISFDGMRFSLIP